MSENNSTQSEPFTKCYKCNVQVEPRAYPEGKCPICGLTYTLRDDEWDWYECSECGEESTSQYCADCQTVSQTKV